VRGRIRNRDQKTNGRRRTRFRGPDERKDEKQVKKAERNRGVRKKQSERERQRVEIR
jgi:hypothetical protein